MPATEPCVVPRPAGRTARRHSRAAGAALDDPSAAEPDGTAWSTPRLREPVTALLLLDNSEPALIDSRNTTLGSSFDRLLPPPVPPHTRPRRVRRHDPPLPRHPRPHAKRGGRRVHLAVALSLKPSKATREITAGAGTASPSDEFRRTGVRVELFRTPAASLREHTQLMLDEGIVLQAWRRAILSDPYNVTGSWPGPDACVYHDGFCAPSPQEPDLTVADSVNLNHADLGSRTTVEFLQNERGPPAAPQRPLHPRRARCPAAAPTLLLSQPLDAATASQIPTPPREASSLALVAASSKSGAHSVHAARLFDEMWSYHSVHEFQPERFLDEEKHVVAIGNDFRFLAIPMLISSLVASSGTNIVDGLMKGAKVIEDLRLKNPVCSIVLLSDGHHVKLHTFNFGSDHDSATMHNISDISSGKFSFIGAEGSIQDGFAQCIGGFLSVVVKEMRLGIECVDNGVLMTSIKSGGYTSQVAGNECGDSVDIGDLYADEERGFPVTLCFGSVDVQYRHPWPPPNQLELLSDGVHHRPTPWPSFSCLTTWHSTSSVQKCPMQLLSGVINLRYWKHQDEVWWMSLTWEWHRTFNLPDLATWYDSAHTPISSAFVSLLACQKLCDPYQLLVVLTVDKFSNLSTLLHPFTAHVHAPAAVLLFRIRGSLLTRLQPNNAIMQLKRGGSAITQLGLFLVLILAETHKIMVLFRQLVLLLPEESIDASLIGLSIDVQLEARGHETRAESMQLLHVSNNSFVLLMLVGAILSQMLLLHGSAKQPEQFQFWVPFSANPPNSQSCVLQAVNM